MAVVTIDNKLHEEVPRAISAMCRSNEAQTEVWMKMRMLAKANPAKTFNDIVRAELLDSNVHLVPVAVAWASVQRVVLLGLI